jgi:hypothetical protein
MNFVHLCITYYAPGQKKSKGQESNKKLAGCRTAADYGIALAKAQTHTVG